MAIKINVDHTVYAITPPDGQYTIGELHDEIGTHIEPLCFDHFWLLYDEDGKKRKKELNQIASLVFGVPLYGPVLAVPSIQMPSDWDIYDENEQVKYETADIDRGILLTIQKAVTYQRSIAGTNAPIIPQEEWVYDPNDETPTKGDLNMFYSNVFDYIINNPSMFKNENTIFSDVFLRIKVAKDEDQRKVVDKLIKHFELSEEYEKCSILKREFIK